MATERPFADIEEEITANHGGPQYINANYPPALKDLLRELYGSCVTANDFQRLYTVAHNIDVINEKCRSIIITKALEPIRKNLKARRISALNNYAINWNNDNIDAVTADDWQTLNGLCRDSFKFAMAQRGSRTAIRRKDNVVSKFYNICRLFALKFGGNENVIWDRLDIDRAAGSYHAILTFEPDIYMARFSFEQLKEGFTLSIIEARNSWLNIAKRAGCRDLEIFFFNQRNDAVRISNALAQVAEDYLRRQGYLNGQGNNLAQALQALNVVDDDEEEADDEEEEENEENADREGEEEENEENADREGEEEENEENTDREGEEEENEENTDREGEDEENLEVEEEKPGTSAGTSGQINASPKLEVQTAPKEEKPDI